MVRSHNVQVLGACLQIPFEQSLKDGEQVNVSISWATGPDSTALQWLEPSQTAEGNLPYLFSHCHAIHARSFVPCQVQVPSCSRNVRHSFPMIFNFGHLRSLHSLCRLQHSQFQLSEWIANYSAIPVQYDKNEFAEIWLQSSLQDSPSVKCPYTASVNVPKEMKALMSANLDSTDGKEDKANSKRRIYTFHQHVPISSYLLAIACGNLEHRQIGPRSKVGFNQVLLICSQTSNLFQLSVTQQQHVARLELLAKNPSREENVKPQGLDSAKVPLLDAWLLTGY